MATAALSTVVRHLFTKKVAFGLALGYGAKRTIDNKERRQQEADDAADLLVEEKMLECLRDKRPRNGTQDWTSLDAAMIVHFYRHRPEQLKFATTANLFIEARMHASEKFKRDLALALPFMIGAKVVNFDGPEQMLDSDFQGSIKFPEGVQKIDVLLGRMGGRAKFFSVANPTLRQRAINFFGEIGLVHNDKSDIVLDGHSDCTGLTEMAVRYYDFRVPEPNETPKLALPLSWRLDENGRTDGSSYVHNNVADIESFLCPRFDFAIPQSAYNRMSKLKKLAKLGQVSTLIFKSAPELRDLKCTQMTTEFDSKRYPIVCDGLQHLTVLRATGDATEVIEHVLKGGARFSTEQ